MADELSDQKLFEFAQAPPEAPAEAPAESPAPESVPVEEPPVPAPAAVPEEVIPSWRLREEAEARRTAEDRARTLETRLNEITAHLQQQQVPQKNDFFENPDRATQAIVQQYIQPLAEEYRKGMMTLGKTIAEVAHGADKVGEAEQAFLAAMNDRQLDPVDYERVVQSPNRYDAVVQWHNRQSTLATVGNDPAAWFEKQLETRMADPKFQAALMEKVRTGASAKAGSVKIPPSLSRTTAAASNSQDAVGDLSDSSLFAHAMKR